MPDEITHQHPVNSGDNDPSDDDPTEEYSALTKSVPSITESIANAIVVKNENVFLVTRPDGSIPIEGNHGFGLYYHDCRYLNGYQIKLAGSQPHVLVANAGAGFRAVFELTNPEIHLGVADHIPRDQIGIKWERMIDARTRTLHDLLTIHNYSRTKVDLTLSFNFRSGFEDIFAIRGLMPEHPGQVQPPQWEKDVLLFRYKGADNLTRSLSIHFEPKPQEKENTVARFDLSLESREEKELFISLVIAETEDKEDILSSLDEQVDLKEIETGFHRSADEWIEGHSELRSDSLLLNEIMERSLRDLRTLRNNFQGEEYFSAGIPWFATLFGRDSLITGLEILAFNPEIAAETLRLLAKYQGQQFNDFRDEQPGKILHELRIGELAHLNDIPHTPYYGTVDATPLFLVLIAQHAKWTGDLSLFHELRGNIDAALEWIAKYGDANQDGFIEYQSRSNRGLINQGWKDSDESIVNADGSLAATPISLVEVQGYVYMAKIGLSDLFERAGESEIAGRLREEARRIRSQFNKNFWLEELNFYALALQSGGKPAAVISSNPGQALWTGIITEDKAKPTVERLMAPDMFNGWGIRTLSADNCCYNPEGYHVGTVWPHDNALIAAGFRRYGFDEQAMRVFNGVFESAMNFEHYRLPEVFAGFNKEDYRVPVRYPVACHPQAWSAGSIPFLLTSCLGLEPNAFKKRLRLIRPILPDFVDWIQLRRLKVGEASVDLKFERTASGYCKSKVLKLDGQLEVEVETEL